MAVGGEWAGVQTSCTSITRREVALRLLEWGEGLVSESGWGGNRSMPHPRVGWALREHEGRATSQ